MNFLFDHPLNCLAANHKGQFCEEQHGVPRPDGHEDIPPLEKSRNWLKLQGTHVGPLEYFSPMGRIWQDQGEISSSTLLIRRPSEPIGAGVLVRIASSSKSARGIDASTLEVELAICFGNADPTLQEYASPFREGADGPLRTTFIKDRRGPNQPDRSWCFDIGEIRRWPESQNRTGRYGFALGIRVYGLDEYPLDFSMDPEMDVSI
jgi:hypothetical protein